MHQQILSTLQIQSACSQEIVLSYILVKVGTVTRWKYVISGIWTVISSSPLVIRPILCIAGQEIQTIQ